VAARRLGQLERAIRLIGESLELAQKYGYASMVLECIASLAGIAADMGRGLQGARLMGVVEAQRGTSELGTITQKELPRDASQLRTMLGDAIYEAVLLEGQAMTQEQAVQLAKDVVDFRMG